MEQVAQWQRSAVSAQPLERGLFDLADPARPHAQLAGDLGVALDALAADAEAQRQDAALAVLE